MCCSTNATKCVYVIYGDFFQTTWGTIFILQIPFGTKIYVEKVMKTYCNFNI